MKTLYLKLLTCVFLLSGVYEKEVSEVNKKNERTWKKVEYKKEWEIDAYDEENDSINFLNPVDFKVDKEGEVYLLDYGDLTVRVFNQAGEFTRGVGGSRGRGPGELLHPTGFDIDDSGRIWISDSANSRILVFDKNGDIIKTIVPDEVPSRIAVDSSGEYFVVLMQNPTSSALFALYNKEGEMISQFGKIIDEQYRNAIVLDGRITLDNQIMYYTPVWAGLYISYNLSGETIFRNDMIDSGGFPDVVFDANGGSRINPDARMYARGVTVVDDKVAILAILNSPQQNERVLDMYESQNGSYLYSLSLPETVRSARLTDNMLYTLTDDRLTAWSFSLVNN